MKKIITLILLIAIFFSSCARKNIPKQTIINNCDSLIEQTLKQLKNQPIDIDCEDSSYIEFCNILKMHNIELIKKLSDKDYNILVLNQVIDSLEKRPLTIIDKSKHKTKTKNSNNQIENTRLKNSIQIKDSQLDSVSFENLALKGRIRDLEKSKIAKSTTGENSPNIAKSGNTTKKASWYLWVIVFVAGGITAIGTRAIITKTI